ncbi:MAG TPA: endonuclease/exonuclease/phosphatase family protein [Streptosporangiaceae bacterium]|jgi:endonuclease/exonuclease/phosphatase (EEP) superfamily protein YafD
MSFRHLEWMAAGGLAGWAAARLGGADRLSAAQSWTAPVFSFTPQAAAAAWAGGLLLRDRRARTLSVCAGLALAGAVAPRAMRRRQPDAAGPVLRVLTTNLLFGRADPAAVTGLARLTGADVLFVQELTDRSVKELDRAGLGGLLPHRVLSPASEGLHDTGIFARHPLDAQRASPWSCGARLILPGRAPVRLVCVHTPPPKPPWYPQAAARWREELTDLAQLPEPARGDRPMIMAGDFNATLDHAQLRRLLGRGYLDAASQAGNGLAGTWRPKPGWRPALLTIDHVLVDPRCAVLATATRPVAGTDHLALFAQLRLPA